MSELNQVPRVPWVWIGPLLAFMVSAFVFVAWRAAAYPNGVRDGSGSPWYALAIFEVCWLTLGGVLSWGGLRQALTKLSASGVSQLTLRGWVTLQWDDVSEVREVAGGRVLEVRGGGKVIRISPLFYTHSDDTSEWLIERIPASARSRLTSA